jgi:hypothetical protein
MIPFFGQTLASEPHTNSSLPDFEQDISWRAYTEGHQCSEAALARTANMVQPRKAVTGSTLGLQGVVPIAERS